MSFADSIRDIRRKSLLSQSDFAQQIGVIYSTVNRWETGKTLPTYKAMKSIGAYGTSHNIDFDLSLALWKERK